MDVTAYLDRIGYCGGLVPTRNTLKYLHHAHLCSVPFENLDIVMGRPIVLALPTLFEKIVSRWRGGFCYELNALFGWLLRELGFQVEMLSARVFSGGMPGPDFDHMLLLVGSDQIADVGFGDSFIEPLPLDRRERDQMGRRYRLVEQGDVWELQQSEAGSEWMPQYCFSLLPRQLSEFHAMCRYQQTSPDSVFTRKSVCSRATPEGRITLSNGRLIITSGGGRLQRPIKTVQEYRALLRKYFGFDLGEEVDLSHLIYSASSEG